MHGCVDDGVCVCDIMWDVGYDVVDVACDIVVCVMLWMMVKVVVEWND